METDQDEDSSRSVPWHMTPSPDQQFAVNETVLAKFKDLFYEAKVLQWDPPTNTYQVHYNGYNKSFDEWKPVSELLRASPDEIEKHRKIRKEAEEKVRAADEEKNKSKGKRSAGKLSPVSDQADTGGRKALRPRNVRPFYNDNVKDWTQQFRPSDSIDFDIPKKPKPEPKAVSPEHRRRGSSLPQRAGQFLEKRKPSRVVQQSLSRQKIVSTAIRLFGTAAEVGVTASTLSTAFATEPTVEDLNGKMSDNDIKRLRELRKQLCSAVASSIHAPEQSLSVLKLSGRQGAAEFTVLEPLALQVEQVLSIRTIANAPPQPTLADVKQKRERIKAAKRNPAFLSLLPPVRLASRTISRPLLRRLARGAALATYRTSKSSKRASLDPDPLAVGRLNEEHAHELFHARSLLWSSPHAQFEFWSASNLPVDQARDENSTANALRKKNDGLWWSHSKLTPSQTRSTWNCLTRRLARKGGLAPVPGLDYSSAAAPSKLWVDYFASCSSHPTIHYRHKNVPKSERLSAVYGCRRSVIQIFTPSAPPRVTVLPNAVPRPGEPITGLRAWPRRSFISPSLVFDSAESEDHATHAELEKLTDWVRLELAMDEWMGQNEECLVKWLGLGHVHCCWVRRGALIDLQGGKIHVAAYLRRQKRLLSEKFATLDEYNQTVTDWERVEAVEKKRQLEAAAASDSQPPTVESKANTLAPSDSPNSAASASPTPSATNATIGSSGSSSTSSTALTSPIALSPSPSPTKTPSTAAAPRSSSLGFPRWQERLREFERFFPLDYCRVERVVARRRATSHDASQSKPERVLDRLYGLPPSHTPQDLESVNGYSAWEYLVKWARLSYDECSWETAPDLLHTLDSSGLQALKEFTTRLDNHRAGRTQLPAPALVPIAPTPSKAEMDEDDDAPLGAPRATPAPSGAGPSEKDLDSVALPSLSLHLDGMKTDSGPATRSSSAAAASSTRIPKKEVMAPASTFQLYKNGLRLRQYQVEGVNWLAVNWHYKRNCIIADEMGLGKTAQTVCFLNYLATRQKLSGPFLVVTPLSTCAFWRKEVERWTDLYVISYTGSHQARKVIRQSEFHWPSSVSRGNGALTDMDTDALETDDEVEEVDESEEESEEDEDDEDDEDGSFRRNRRDELASDDTASEEEVSTPKRKQNAARGKAKKKSSSDDEATESDDEAPPPPPKRTRAASSNKRARQSANSTRSSGAKSTPQPPSKKKKVSPKSAPPRGRTRGKGAVNQYKFQVMITSYEIVCKDRSILSQVPWQCIIVDEAQRMKNNESLLFTTLLDFKCPRRLLLTGTPIQNNLQELWALLHFLHPEQFPSAEMEAFLARFGDCRTVEKVEELYHVLRPFVIRRLKEDVEPLPPKDEVIVEVELTLSQKKYYRAVYEKNLTVLLGAQKAQRLSSKNALTLLSLQLRKICMHPYLLEGVEDEESADAVTKEQVHQKLIHCSGKLVLLEKLLPKLKAEGHRVLIFSQWTRMLDILEDYLRYRHYTYERLDGNVSAPLRQTSIDRFNAPDSNRFIFLLSTRAGGLGITLTGADTVILFDSDWNLQNDIQAQARAHRIGQTKPVVVYRLLTSRTYEMEMFQRACRKLTLERAVLTSITQTVADNPDESKKGKKGADKDGGPFDKKEIEEMLRIGAYGVFSAEGAEAEREAERSKRFTEEDIDKILSRSRVIRVDEKQKASSIASAFSKATFVPEPDASGGGAAVRLDDPDFWNKLGLKLETEEPAPLPARRAKRVATQRNAAVIAPNSFGMDALGPESPASPPSPASSDSTDVPERIPVQLQIQAHLAAATAAAAAAPPNNKKRAKPSAPTASDMSIFQKHAALLVKTHLVAQQMLYRDFNHSKLPGLARDLIPLRGPHEASPVKMTDRERFVTAAASDQRAIHWIEYFDVASGRLYYHDSVRKLTLWDPPANEAFWPASRTNAPKTFDLEVFRAMLRLTAEQMHAFKLASALRSQENYIAATEMRIDVTQPSAVQPQSKAAPQRRPSPSPSPSPQPTGASSSVQLQVAQSQPRPQMQPQQHRSPPSDMPPLEHPDHPPHAQAQAHYPAAMHSHTVQAHSHPHTHPPHAHMHPSHVHSHPHVHPHAMHNVALHQQQQQQAMLQEEERQRAMRQHQQEIERNNAAALLQQQRIQQQQQMQRLMEQRQREQQQREAELLHHQTQSQPLPRPQEQLQSRSTQQQAQVEPRQALSWPAPGAAQVPVAPLSKPSPPKAADQPAQPSQAPQPSLPLPQAASQVSASPPAAPQQVAQAPPPVIPGPSDAKGPSQVLAMVLGWSAADVVAKFVIKFLKMPKYEENFTKNKVTGSMLLSLTDRDLARFGISDEADRGKILNYVEKLKKKA